MPHSRRRDRQRAAPAATAEVWAEIQHALPGRQALPRDRFQQLQLGVIVRRPDVLNLPRPAMVGVHDLHRGGARRSRPHIRHRATLRPRISAQIQSPETRNPQLTAMRQLRILDREPSQVPDPVCPRADGPLPCKECGRLRSCLLPATGPQMSFACMVRTASSVARQWHGDHGIDQGLWRSNHIDTKFESGT